MNSTKAKAAAHRHRHQSNRVEVPLAQAFAPSEAFPQTGRVHDHAPLAIALDGSSLRQKSIVGMELANISWRNHARSETIGQDGWPVLVWLWRGETV